jgi:hypothetical protein
MNSRKKSSKRRQRTPYSKGQLNYLIDDLLHPLYGDYEGLRLLDGFLHAIVERDPPLSLRKFFEYNLSALVRKATKKPRRQERK